MLAINDKKVLQIEREATVKPISSVVLFLQESLGQQVTAYLSGLKDSKVVGLWAKGKAKPRFPAEMRLRYAYQATSMLVPAYGSDTAKSWFFGSNSRLDDKAPGSILRHANTPEDLQLLVPAARAFAGAAD